MKQVPDSLLAFQHMFPDDDACAAWLIEMRWPDGFVCPACGHEKGWALRRKAHTFECAGCRRQTSVTAGTILHASKLPLTVWFWAAYLMATHSNGISALQLQKQLRYRLLPQRLAARPQAARQHGRPRAQPVVGPGGNRRGQPSIPDPKTILPPEGKDAATTARCSSSAPSNSGTETSQAACGWPKSPPTAPPTSDTSSKPPPIPTPSRKPTAGPATLRSPPIATMSMSSGRPPLTSSCRGSTKSSPTSKDGREASTTGCVASICRPISMSSSFASTAAKPATLLSARSSASPPMQNPLPTAC